MAYVSWRMCHGVCVYWMTHDATGLGLSNQHTLLLYALPLVLWILTLQPRSLLPLCALDFVVFACDWAAPTALLTCVVVLELRFQVQILLRDLLWACTLTAVSCCLVLSRAVSCCLVLSRAVSCCLMLSHAVSCCLVLSRAVSCCLVLSRAVSCCLVLSHAVSCCLVLSRAVSCCLVLSRAVSCCLVLSLLKQTVAERRHFSVASPLRPRGPHAIHLSPSRWPVPCFSLLLCCASLCLCSLVVLLSAYASSQHGRSVCRKLALQLWEHL
jgi:hypothetical protein